MILLGLLEVLYWDEIPLLQGTISRLMARYHPDAGNHGDYERARDAFYRNTIHGKEDFLRRVENYRRNGGPVWASGRNEHFDELSPEQLEKAFRCAREERGRELAERPRGGWAEPYAAKVLGDTPQRILELTVGAGGGTGAVAARMREGDIMVGVDIDFVCAKNADAIGRYYGVDLLGVCSDLWRLPFAKESFSVVCCLKGLNECREVPTILQEAARVLMPGGRMVMILPGRTGYAYRALFDLFDISEEEGLELLKEARLFSTLEDVDAELKRMGIVKTDRRLLESGDYLVSYQKKEKGAFRYGV